MVEGERFHSLHIFLAFPTLSGLITNDKATREASARTEIPSIDLISRVGFYDFGRTCAANDLP